MYHNEDIFLLPTPRLALTALGTARKHTGTYMYDYGTLMTASSHWQTPRYLYLGLYPTVAWHCTLR